MAVLDAADCFNPAQRILGRTERLEASRRGDQLFQRSMVAFNPIVFPLPINVDDLLARKRPVTPASHARVKLIFLRGGGGC